MKISELRVGETLAEPKSGMILRVAAQNHYMPGATTLISEHVLRCAAFDALEPENTGKTRWWDDPHKYGSNDYALSNIHMWLNSSEKYWYRPAHEFDSPPDIPYLRYGEQPNFDIPGLLYDFAPEFVEAIIETDVPVLKRTAKDKGELTTVRARVFLPSRTELGLGDESGFAEGSPLPFFAGRQNLGAVPTEEQLAIHGRSWNPGWDFGSRTSARLDEPQIYDPKYGWWYWARTPHLRYGYLVRVMSPYGALTYTMAYNDIVGVRVLMNVDGDAELE